MTSVSASASDEAWALLRLMQLFDSQFPIGAFAHSSGLETYAQYALSPDALYALQLHNLQQGWGKLELAACALAWQQHQDPQALQQLCWEVDAWKSIPGLHKTSLSLGKRWARLVTRLFPDYDTETINALQPKHAAVVIGVLAAQLHIPQKNLLLAYAQSTLSASLAAATRCMPLSPEQSQEILLRLQASIIEAVQSVLADPAAALFSATPTLDIRAHQQALLHTRLFQS